MSKGYGKIKSEEGRPFVKNDPRINRKGRPRKLVTDTIKKLKDDGVQPVSKSDIKDIYLSLINIPIPELKELVKDDTETVLVRIVGKNILSGRGFDIIESMLDRAIGKATQQVNKDITTNGKDI